MSNTRVTTIRFNTEEDHAQAQALAVRLGFIQKTGSTEQGGPRPNLSALLRSLVSIYTHQRDFGEDFKAFREATLLNVVNSVLGP